MSDIPTHTRPYNYVTAYEGVSGPVIVYTETYYCRITPEDPESVRYYVDLLGVEAARILADIQQSKDDAQRGREHEKRMLSEASAVGRERRNRG